MAEKIVSIKIVANTDNAGNSVKKLAVEFDRLEKSQITISSIEQKRNLLLAEQVKAASRLIAVQDKLNSSNLSANFTIGALQSSFTKYKKEIQATEQALKALSNAQTLGINPNAKTATGSPGARLTTPATPQAGFSYISGAGGVAAAKAVKEQESLAKATDLVTTSQKALKSALVETNIQHKNMFVHIGEIIGIYRLYNAAINLTQKALLAIPDAGLQQEANQAGLLGIFGSEEARKNLEFVSKVATKAGVSLTVLERAYSRYATSAILAGASQEQVNKSFKDFAEVGSILKLPEEKLDSLFLALDQMYAKGVVQSEEIKKQLGNVLPGAVEIGAQAIGKTPAAFMEAMKKNLVIATEFVPLFAAKYREIFGGPDDSVFRLVSDKLRSNLERVQNEFTFISREIYTSTRETMNSTVKLFAESLTAIRSNLTGIGQSIELFSVLLTARLGLSLVEAALKVDILLKKLPALTRAITGLPNPITAAAGAMAVMYSRLIGLSAGYSEAEGFTVSFKDETVSLTSYLKAVVITTYNSVADALDSIGISIEKLVNIDAKAVWDGLLPDKNDLADFLGYVNVIKNQIPEANGMRLKATSDEDAFQAARNKFLASIDSGQDNVMAKAGKIDKEAYIKSFNGKGATEVSEAIAQGKLKTAQEITDALAQADLTIKAPTVSVIKGESEDVEGGARGKSKALKEARDQYKEINALMKTASAETELYLDKNSIAYQQNLIDLGTYYKEKRSIIEADFEAQNSFQREIIRKAENAGDSTKIAQAEEDLQQLQINKSKALQQLEAERFSEAIANNTTLRNITAEYYTVTGQSEKALQLQLEDKYGLIKNALRGQIEAGNSLKQVDLDRIETIEKISKAESAAAIAKASVQGKLNLNAADQERINVLRNIGAIDELTAARQLSSVYEKEIELKEQLIALDVKKLETKTKGTSEYEQLKNDIDEARASLENFKLTGNTVGQYFQTQLTPAFTNAFTGFITGSLSAKEAFASFAQDILKRIADIAAQQLATQLIGGLIGGAGKLFGSSSVDAFGANATGRIIAQATGGVNIGMGGGNGYVLTSPTLYPNAKPIPFASGGVLAGEAGAEAVLPLKRTSSGKLGVETSGGSNGSTYNVVVNVEKSPNETPEDTGNKIAIAMMKKIAQSEIANANRPGNQSNKITTFG